MPELTHFARYGTEAGQISPHFSVNQVDFASVIQILQRGAEIMLDIINSGSSVPVIGCGIYVVLSAVYFHYIPLMPALFVQRTVLNHAGNPVALNPY